MNEQEAGRDRAGDDRRRAAWMRVLALAGADELDRAFAGLGELPARRWLRVPQTGLAMVRARAGGTGAQFNLGEVTLTRCAVVVDERAVGVAYVRGGDSRQAEQAAMADALMQMPQWQEAVRSRLIEPLARSRRARLAQAAAQAESSRVEFFTLARGDD